jgi:hypothetical protein
MTPTLLGILVLGKIQNARREASSARKFSQLHGKS